jgi:hypothetical protein
VAHRLFDSKLVALGAVILSTSCGGTSEPELPPRLEFSAAVVDLGLLRDGQVELRNTGGRSIGPIEVVSGAIQDSGGSTVPGSVLAADPTEIPTLNAGEASTVSLSLSLQGSLNPGEYDAAVTARGGLESTAFLAVRFTVLNEAEKAAASIQMSVPNVDPRTGDVIAIPIEVRDDAGALLQGAPVAWSVEPAIAGYVGSSGQFVGYSVGPAQLIARVGTVADTAEINVVSRNLTGSFTVVRRGRETARHSSDLWLHGNVAYSGTWGARTDGELVNFGNTLNVWDVSGAGNVSKVSSLEIDARVVNDVKVRADGELAIITHEGSNDGLNGITILDLEDPSNPVVVGRFSSELEAGVHNVWIEGDYAYLVVDGVGNGLRILDISDPALPTVVGRYWAGSSFLHDVYVRDGLAFLSHWSAGLVILDVGNGVAGGSPDNPVEVSRLEDLSGQTHNAWYWPEAGYVFVGEEDFTAPGIIHVVDLRNLFEPREVATYRVPGQTPHNVWLDEDTGTLYVAWYANGLRAIDVTGDLLGELDRQGREIAGSVYNGGVGSCNRGSGDTCSWGPQLHQGLIWVSDMNEGLIALELPR